MQSAGVSGVGEGSSSLPVKGIHTAIMIMESEPVAGHMAGKAGRHRRGDVPMAASIPGSRTDHAASRSPVQVRGRGNLVFLWQQRFILGRKPRSHCHQGKRSKVSAARHFPE